VLKKLVRELTEPYEGMKKMLSRCRWQYYLQPELVVGYHQVRFRLWRLYQQLSVYLRGLYVEQGRGMLNNG